MNLKFCISLLFLVLDISLAFHFDSTLLNIRAKRSPRGGGGFGGGHGGFGGGPGGFGGGRGGFAGGFGGGRGVGGFGRGFDGPPGGRGFEGRPVFGGIGGGIIPVWFYRRRSPYLYGPYGSFYYY